MPLWHIADYLYFTLLKTVHFRTLVRLSQPLAYHFCTLYYPIIQLYWTKCNIFAHQTIMYKKYEDRP